MTCRPERRPHRRGGLLRVLRVLRPRGGRGADAWRDAAGGRSCSRPTTRTRKPRSTA